MAEVRQLILDNEKVSVYNDGTWFSKRNKDILQRSGRLYILPQSDKGEFYMCRIDFMFPKDIADFIESNVGKNNKFDEMHHIDYFSYMKENYLVPKE